MSGSRELQQELSQINRRMRDCERQLGYAEDRIEMYRRQQWSYAMRPNYSGGTAKHMSKTLAVAGLLEKLKRDQEKRLVELNKQRDRLENEAQHKQREIERQKQQERQRTQGDGEKDREKQQAAWRERKQQGRRSRRDRDSGRGMERDPF